MSCIRLQNNPAIPEEADGRAVSLAELLAGRDNRQARQRQWLHQQPATLVVLTVVTPGAVKDSELTRRIFNAGWQQIQQRRWPVLRAEAFTLATGCEGFWLVDAKAEAVKAQTIVLESDEPLGRLWDIDVLTFEGEILSRRERGLPERQCLLCALPAKVCARQRTHDVAGLLAEMTRRADAAFKPQ
ncbi:citrate lyase holo-[acyl-carrier protein] synthase [Pantoea sp. BAV 3049]|uniref:citrate lyase holo-[acyl-carrier protein] synthase n=1 Tax=Pantoea sp. BAV 3049 TaxID=2654188 RepID=UPI00131E8BDD|nr:citrate lyase holo-[acyl-carrier protein] synthase [Pantoea sp. BAV 3049]